MNEIKPRTASDVIYQGDDLATLADLRQAAAVAERKAEIELNIAQARARAEAPRRIGEMSPEDPQVAYDAAVKPSQDAYDAFVDEAAERAVVWTVQAIGRKAFRVLMLAHPPRTVETVEDDAKVEKPHEDDASWGVNVETFPEALLTYAEGDDRTLVEPEFESSADRQKWLDRLAEGDFEKMWATAYQLNRAVSADPLASRFSPAPQSSTAT